MEYGLINGVAPQVSKLILGTMSCSDNNMENAAALFDAFAAAGGNAFDTAHIYSGGGSERSLGRWIAERKNRDKVVIAGKGAHHDSSGPRVNPTAITQDLMESLERLNTDYIDLYLLHRDNETVPVGPIVESLHAHREAGRIRAYGGSNWTTKRIQAANDYAAEHGLFSFSANSPHYSLASTNGPMWPGCVTLSKEDFQWHERHQFPMLPWSSQAAGFFTGRFSPDVNNNGDVERTFYNEGNWKRFERARELAQAKNATANQAALAYVLHAPFPVFALVGPKTTEELATTLPAIHISLTNEEREWLNLERDTHA